MAEDLQLVAKLGDALQHACIVSTSDPMQEATDDPEGAFAKTWQSSREYASL